MHYLKALNWRYACKKMNGEKIPSSSLDNILEATRLSTSSYGLQPYKILVIENQDIKTKILPIAYNQTVVRDCSHLLVFCSFKKLLESHISDYIALISKTRKTPLDQLEAFKANLMSFASRKEASSLDVWVKKQCYIALGSCLQAAALEQVDSTPMEGFNPNELDDLLDLSSENLSSVVLCALGYRDDTDLFSKMKKVRKSAQDLYKFI